MEGVNVFKLCSGLKVLGYLMILLVAGIIAVSYYAVVVVTFGPRLLRSEPLACAALFAFHVLLFMLLWSYVRAVFKDPGSVPENWREEGEDLESGSNGNVDEVGDAVPADDLATMAGVRYCNKCQNGKPPRCHHCSVCQRCVLKMDHHCVWVVNCVGACNYKFFLLFLLYTFLETLLDTLVLLPGFINFFHDAKKHSSSPALHASLVLSNTTSVEVYEKRGTVRWKYDLGQKNNFEQVFGTKKTLWLLPMFSKEDLDNMAALHGLHFPTRSDIDA